MLDLPFDNSAALVIVGVWVTAMQDAREARPKLDRTFLRLMVAGDDSGLVGE
jgi:hypothetical protein